MAKIEFHFVRWCREHRKANCRYKNAVATINLYEYKNILLNNKCLRHSINRTQSKNHNIGTYEISKTDETEDDLKKGNISIFYRWKVV